MGDVIELRAANQHGGGGDDGSVLSFLRSIITRLEGSDQVPDACVVVMSNGDYVDVSYNAEVDTIDCIGMLSMASMLEAREFEE